MQPSGSRVDSLCDQPVMKRDQVLSEAQSSQHTPLGRRRRSHLNILPTSKNQRLCTVIKQFIINKMKIR
jgi:hypothetical protein